MKSHWVVLLVLFSAAPAVSQLVNKISYGTPERELTSVDSALHVIKAATGETFKYHGTMANGKYIAVVDAELNGGVPCDKTIASGIASAQQSGVVQASADSTLVTLPQTTLLDWDKDDGNPRLYAVCAAQGDGTAADNSWEDSSIRLRVSPVTSLASHGITHHTSGHIAQKSGLKLQVGGTLPAGKYVSLVDQTLNSNFPCADGTEAAATFGTVYSGPLQTTANEVTINTADMTTYDSSGGFSPTITNKNFAVCFTTGDGTTAANW